tara:strand:+ start:490 stop:1152 length:663 start_codon:yes stop_codon:yes gene_type:complete
MISVHHMKSTVTASAMFKFQQIASQHGHAERTFVGSIAGGTVVSVNSGFAPKGKGAAAPNPPSNKRARDSGGEDAERALAKVKRSNEAATITAASYAAAKQCIQELLRLRGAGGEAVVESWVVSMRQKGQWGATDGREGLMLGVRLAAGVALPLSALCHTLRVCRDGVLTTDTSRVDPSFDLPLSDQGRVAEGSGQRSLLLMAAVPHLEDPPSDVTSNLK